MSLRAELETWDAALKAYDAEDFEKALDLFGVSVLPLSTVPSALTSEHELAVEQFNAATGLDQYLAVAYFQCGVSNFLLGRYDYAYKDFEEALLYLRGNQAINYEQLGLQFRLYSAEVLFNKGLCHIYLGNSAEGMQDMQEAKKEKVTEEHNVIDEAIRDMGEGYTVFSIVSLVSTVLEKSRPSKWQRPRHDPLLRNSRTRGGSNCYHITRRCGGICVETGLEPPGLPSGQSDLAILFLPHIPGLLRQSY
ncbi:SubName: Full=Related to NADPH oxidase cytosolic protein p67phox {ECO:0000313/EMBL:CCA67529.1} [Serendipita indica DSM 11827]|nr:SubName: Full=Related to NADPH oxidase cytosolic protein p67phox {ECO:0000313/EMBL:CCA67529.1} [Serendipita indica DSM 11827]